jgi:hypothetical protein
MIIKDKIEYLVGNKKIYTDSILPYDKKIISFLDDLSKELGSKKEIQKFSDIKSLSFFCRKANLDNIVRKILFNSSSLRLAIGLIFHITPSNVPTNFIYSLIFGLLNGNSNIIKVPSKKFEQIDIICNTLNRILSKKKHKEIRKLIKIVRYEKSHKFTQDISSICDARIIWGGDKSIAEIKEFKTKINCVDLTFSDRYSFCIINADKFLNFSNNKKRLLVEKFFNDSYTMDQNACSSPHLILWYGKKYQIAKQTFWSYLNNVTDHRYKIENSAAVNKYNLLCKNLILNKTIKNFKTFSNNIYTIELKEIQKNISNLRGQSGFFYEYKIKNLNMINNFITKKFQTLTYCGFNKEVLKRFILNNNPKGIDRIVPVGRALEIDFFWDGFDINKILTRVIDIK